MSGTEFLEKWNEQQKKVYTTALEHGWWEEQNFNVGEKIALMHSELSEALEAFRKGNGPSDKIPKWSHAEEEFADAVIRLMDLSEKMGLDVAGAIVAKAKYNESRPYRHGDKKF
ncbi:MAG TPA: hypothetical protein VKH45_04675 [Candidatus Acidoferrum sp.]|nr:hypothetical protein [Candidatus Acidoferrum sp.]